MGFKERKPRDKQSNASQTTTTVELGYKGIQNNIESVQPVYCKQNEK